MSDKETPQARVASAVPVGQLDGVGYGKRPEDGETEQAGDEQCGARHGEGQAG